MCSVAQSYLTLCSSMDCSLPGSSANRIFQARVLECVLFPTPGDLPNPGIEPTSLASPALVDRFFTTSTTWEALKSQIKLYYKRSDLVLWTERLCSPLSPKFLCWNPIPTVLVSGNEAFGRWLGHEDEVLINGISAALKKNFWPHCLACDSSPTRSLVPQPRI